MSKRALAWTIAAVTMAMYAAFGVIYLTPLTPAVVYHEAGDISTLLFVLPFTAFALVGGVIASRRPENPVGWLILAGAALLGVGSLSDLLASVLTHGHNPAGPWVGLGGVFWSSGVSPSTACFISAVLLFPDGRLRSSRWRVLIVVLIFLACANFVELVIPGAGSEGIGYTSDPSVNPASPLAIAGAGGAVNAYAVASGFAEVALFVLALVSVLLRLRGADAERRHQIKWFAAGAVATVVCTLVPGFLPSPANPSAALLAAISALALIGGLALPASVAVAMFKYRLYDIDIIISRTLVYGALAALITAVYVGIAVGIGSLVGSGGQPNLGLSVLATIIVAAGFQPARERLQRVANRLVYGRRATPYQVLSEFSRRVAETYSAADVVPRMAAALQSGTGAESATVWLRRGVELRPAATHPADRDGQAPVAFDGATLPPLPGDRAVAVRDQGELLGALAVTKRRGESLTPAETKLVDDLAQQAALVLKNVELTDELMLRVDELRESRQRLVQAQDQERRRLERNLHDGAQQHLVALKVKLALAKRLAEKDPARARDAVAQLKSDADEALETLRDLARGIYPPLLADRGLVAALEAQARKATLPVIVEAQAVSRYTPEVEATVYFCVLEALQNAMKYAVAQSVTVRLSEDASQLRFEVADDGAGFDPAGTRRGAGLTNMDDRLEALGGSLQIEASPGAGTVLRGSLPVEQLVTAAV